jgi:hypothetical protein
LDEIMMITTDEYWLKQFLDRTDEKNRKKPMNKLLRLKNIAIYWNAKEQGFLGDVEKFIVVDKMTKMILKDDTLQKNPYVDYVISVTAEAKLIQNYKFDFAVPEYQFWIDLNEINIHLKNSQFEQIVGMLETFFAYNRMMMVER